MLFSSADQRDGSNSWGISVHRQAAEEGNGGHINLRGSAVDLGTISAATANERDPAGMHDNTIDMPNRMGNTVHRTTAETHDSLVIELEPRKRYAFHVVALVGERPRQGSSTETHAGLVRAHKQTIVCVACESLVCLQQARAAASWATARRKACGC